MEQQGQTAVTMSRQELRWLLGSLCALYRIPFDGALFEQQFPPPYNIESLFAAARAYGLRASWSKFTPHSLHKLPFPCIAFLRAADTPDDARTEAAEQERATAPPRGSVALLLKVDRERLLLARAGSTAPETAPLRDVEPMIGRDLILVSTATADIEDAESPDRDAAVNLSGRKFGFRWFVPELLKHRSIWRDVLLASLAIQLVGLATPLFTQVVIDKVVVHQTGSTLVAVAVAMAMFILFHAGMTWMRQYLMLHTGNRIDAVLCSEVLRHLFRLPIAYFEKRPTGTLVARLHGVEDIRQFVSGAAISMFLDVPFLFVFLAVMFLYSPQLTWIALGMLVLLVIVSLLVTPILRARLNRQFLLGARNQAFVTEYVSGMGTVKSLQMEPVLETRYGDYLATYLEASFRTRQLSNSYNVVANTLEQALTLAILAVGALLVMRNDGFTIGMLVAFQMFAARMSQPLLRLAVLWQEFQQAGIAVKRLGDIMDVPTEPYSVVPQRASSDKPGRIELQNVSFRYSDHHPFLFRNLNLAFKPGCLSVLLGPSGCGKSTLAKLLQAFYLPTDGVIRIDGCDIRQMSANELRATFGVVPQETVLFSGTVYDNLHMAKPNASFEDIVAAAKQAEIHEFIEQLPQGYQTLIGEHGVGLSGGQRQRIAIARALLKQPQVLIFDEATSSLDGATAEAFARTVNSLKGKVTMIFIAHVLPRGLQVDEVFSFGQGQRSPASPKGMSVVEDVR